MLIPNPPTTTLAPAQTRGHYASPTSLSTSGHEQQSTYHNAQSVAPTASIHSAPTPLLAIALRPNPALECI